MNQIPSEIEQASVTNKQFQNLNGLRFIAALSVLIFHVFTLNREIWGNFSSEKWFQLIYKIASKGHLGVGIFFVLSGFLIGSHLLNEIRLKGKINVGKFFMRRILRIWPLYFLIVLFGFFVFPHLPFGSETKHTLFYYSTFLSNIDEIKVGLYDNLNFLTVTWSVSVEEQFYLFWMLILACIPFLKRGKFFFLYFVLILVLSVVFRWLNFEDPRTLYYHTFSVAGDLAIGGLVSFFVHHYSLEKIIQKLNKLQIVIIYLLGLALVLASRQIFKGRLVCIEGLTLGVFFAFVLLEQAFSNHSILKLDKIPFFYRLGEITYGIYMFHCIVIYYASIAFVKLNLTNSSMYFVMYLLLVLIASILIAQLSFKFLEKPILSLKRYFR